ncbi:MAG: stage III sporulation protein AE [Hydrogeniiclostridium mannosilyticum]
MCAGIGSDYAGCRADVQSGILQMIMMAVGNTVTLLSSTILAPLMNIFLAFSVVGTVSPSVNLSGISNSFSKAVKWILTFCMTIFSRAANHSRPGDIGGEDSTGARAHVLWLAALYR